MRRRNFIVGICASSATWPLAANAQQRVRRIGVLMNLAADDPESQARNAAFLQELQRLGWIDGRNVKIDYRWAGANPDRFRTYSTELVSSAPDVILAYATPAAAALQQATLALPIIFVSVIDPVGAGLVKSLANPGGNLTGFTLFEYSISAKWLELLKQIAPGVTRVAVIRDSGIAAGIGQFSAIQTAAPSLGIELSAISVRQADEIERAVAEFARPLNSGLVVTASSLATTHRDLITPWRRGTACLLSIRSATISTPAG